MVACYYLHSPGRHLALQQPCLLLHGKGDAVEAAGADQLCAAGVHLTAPAAAAHQLPTPHSSRLWAGRLGDDRGSLSAGATMARLQGAVTRPPANQQLISAQADPKPSHIPARRPSRS
jgi:hypothetical protein